MLRSQNGWSANDRDVIASYSLPGGKVALRAGDVSVVLLWCANRWHETVEPLRWPGCWGYAERLIRGSATEVSNHASGTAIDLNAPAHPLGTNPTDNFSTLEIRAIHAILEYCEGVVRWGGDYTGRKDGMHLEINGDAAAVRRIADKIRTPVKKPSPTPRQARALTPPVPRREDDCMLIKTQPDKSKPIYLAALWSGPMFIGLGPTETPTDEQAAKLGIPVMWVEFGTWQDMDRRSHNLCDNPRPVIAQSPVVRSVAPTLTTSAQNTAVISNLAQAPSSQRPPSSPPNSSSPSQ